MRQIIAAVLALSVCISCWIRPPVVVAQSAQGPDGVPVALTISGGISRGAYQAGVNWALVSFLRHSQNPGFRVEYGVPHAYRLAVVTGASAGNVNGTLSAVEWCSGVNRLPEESLFWQMWANTGWEQLFPDSISDPSTVGALLTRRYMEEAVFRAVAERMAAVDLPQNCEIPVGITLTSLDPDSVRIDDAGRIPAVTQRFATVFSIKGERDGPLTFQYPEEKIWADPSLGRVILGERVGASDSISARWVLDAMSASAAFPLAFQPVSINRYWIADQLDQEVGVCLSEEIPCEGSGTFMDGGVFDNNPLDLALGIFSHLRGYDRQDPRVRVVFIDPDAERFPLKSRPEFLRSQPAADRGLAAMPRLAGGFLPSARQYELHALSRKLRGDSVYDTVREHWIGVTTRSQPIFGNYLNAFGAFMGRPLREHDFYAGIYDGLHYAAGDLICRQEGGLRPGESVPECTSERLKRIILGGDLRFGALAPHVVHHAYYNEYNVSLPLSHPWPDTVRIRSAATIPERRDQARSLFLQQLIQANDVMVRRERPWMDESCQGLDWEEALLCRQGFAEVLDRAATPRVVAEARFWARRPACARGKWATSPEDCAADNTFSLLLEDQQMFVRAMAERILHQMWRVEDALGWDPATRKYSQESRIEELELLARTFGARLPGERGWDKDPSSIQTYARHRARPFFHALPFYISTLEGRGAEWGWRPTYNATSHWALILPVSAGWRSGGRGELSGGVGVLGRTPWLLWSGADVALQPLVSFDPGEDPVGRIPVLTVTGYFLADKLRVGLRYVEEPHDLPQDGHWAWTLGVADANGILYWFLRHAR